MNILVNICALSNSVSGCLKYSKEIQFVVLLRLRKTWCNLARNQEKTDRTNWIKKTKSPETIKYKAATSSEFVRMRAKYDKLEFGHE